MMKINHSIYKIVIGNGKLSNGASKLAELDTTILRYNREYPLARRVFGGNVGFPISQATEFACPPGFWRNHRLGEIVAEAKTKKDGSFEIDSVEEGTYNLVAEKAGFGWKYVYEVTIEKGKSKNLSELINSRPLCLPRTLNGQRQETEIIWS